MRIGIGIAFLLFLLIAIAIALRWAFEDELREIKKDIWRKLK